MVKGGKYLARLCFALICIVCFLFDCSAQQNRVNRLSDLYTCLQDCEIEQPKTVLAVAILETGWLECRNCAFQFNNFFGFRTDRRYIRFDDMDDCLEYLYQWQDNYYRPWKLKHPNGTYHQFLVHMRYARNMENYLAKIRYLEKWISANLNSDTTLSCQE